MVTSWPRSSWPASTRLQRGDRHPEFADALLREEAVAVPARRPAGVDVAHRDADLAGEAAAELADPGFQDALGGRLGGRRDARRHGRRHRRRPVGGRAGTGGHWPAGRMAPVDRSRPAKQGPARARPRPNTQPAHHPCSPKTFHPKGFTITGEGRFCQLNRAAPETDRVAECADRIRHIVLTMIGGGAARAVHDLSSLSRSDGEWPARRVVEGQCCRKS